MKYALLFVCACTLCGLALLIAGLVLFDASREKVALIAIFGAAGWFAAVFAYFGPFAREMRDPPQ